MESNMTIRKHCATDKIPTRSPVGVVGSQYRQTERQKTDEHGLCKLVGSSSRKL